MTKFAKILILFLGATFTLVHGRYLNGGSYDGQYSGPERDVSSNTEHYGRQSPRNGYKWHGSTNDQYSKDRDATGEPYNGEYNGGNGYGVHSSGNGPSSTAHGGRGNGCFSLTLSLGELAAFLDHVFLG